MKLHTSLLSLIALLALPLASFAGKPAEGSTTPTVGFGGIAIPGGSQSTSFVITASGSYYLAGERVMTAGVPAITVNAPDVTIDLNGATIRYTTAVVTEGAIYIPNCSNVEVLNGSVVDAPTSGIHAVAGNGLRVKNVRLTACAGSGVLTRADNSTIEDSQATYCGNWGIRGANASSVRVLNCTLSHNAYAGVILSQVAHGEVSRCSATYNGQSGILANCDGCLIADNTAAENNQSKSASDGGIVASYRCMVRGNVVDANYVSGVSITGSGSAVEANLITYTLTANNALGGYAIKSLGGSVLYANNRITSASLLSPGLVNGGGNVLF